MLDSCKEDGKAGDGLAGPRKSILNLQWVKLGGILLYTAEPWRLRNWHQIAVGMGEGGADNSRAKNKETI